MSSRPAAPTPVLQQLYIMSCALQQHLAQALASTTADEAQPSTCPPDIGALTAHAPTVLPPPQLLAESDDALLAALSDETLWSPCDVDAADDELARSISTWMSESHNSFEGPLLTHSTDSGAGWKPLGPNEEF